MKIMPLTICSDFSFSPKPQIHTKALRIIFHPDTGKLKSLKRENGCKRERERETAAATSNSVVEM